IMTSIIRPKVKTAVNDKVRQTLSKKVSLALSKLKMPTTVDLSSAGSPATLDVAEHFDGADFDAAGGEITAALLVHHAVAAGDPGADAPGWLTIGGPPGTMSTDPAFGFSVSLDAVNQALFAAWGQNGLKRTIDNVELAGAVELTPKLPPVVVALEDGTLVASA